MYFGIILESVHFLLNYFCSGNLGVDFILLEG